MPARSDIALLRRIADGQDTPADRDALAERVRTYLDAAPAGGSLDAAFGLARAPGGVSWWRADVLERRDAALRTLAARFYAGLPLARQAAEMRQALATYAAVGWRNDSREAALPTRHIGTERELLFDALNAVDSVPSAGHIRRVLRG